MTDSGEQVTKQLEPPKDDTTTDGDTDYEKRYEIKKNVRNLTGSTNATVVVYSVTRLPQYRSGVFHGWYSGVDFLYDYEAEKVVSILALLELLSEANIELAISESKDKRKETLTTPATPQLGMEY